MARIPVYESGVRTDPLANRRASAFITPAAAGAGFSEALSRLGSGIADVAEAMDYKDQITAKADSDNAYNQYMEHRRQVLYDPETGYLNQTGSNALGGSREAALDELQKRREAVEQGLSPRALADFKRRADGVDNTVKDNAIKHASAQTRVYSSEQTAAAVTASLDAAGLAYNDEETSNAYLNEALNGLTEKALLEGWPKAKLDEALAAATSDTLLTRAIHMAADDPVLADQFLDERQDEIDQNAYLKMKSDLKGAVLSKKANGVVGGIFKPGSPAAASPSTPAALEQGARLIETGKTVLGMDENQRNDAVREYLRSGGVNMDPATAAWSAAYVNGTLGQAGLQGTSSNMARSFLGWGQDASADPQVGDIIVLERGSAPHGYVGFISGVNEDGTFNVLGGDQGGQTIRATQSAPRVSSSGDAGAWAGLEEVKAGIFKGESGGDYGALFGFQNRAGGRYANVDVTKMSVADVLEFQDPNGEYGQWVKEELRRSGKRARVATPVGAYQIVGKTLRAAVKAGVVDPTEKFDEAAQDRVGRWILDTQGTGAWEAYAGPTDPGTVSSSGSSGTRFTDGGVVGIKMNVPTDRVLGIRRGTTVNAASTRVASNAGQTNDASTTAPAATDGPTGSDLSDGLSQIMAIPDPELRTEALKQFEQRLKVRDTKESLEREQLMDDAWTQISEGNENPDNLSPEVQTRIGAPGMASLREAYRQKVTGADVTDPSTYQHFLDQTLSLDPKTQQEFADTNLNDFAGELSEAALKELKIAQAELRQSREIKKSGKAAEAIYAREDYIKAANTVKEDFELIVGSLGAKASDETRRSWQNFNKQLKARMQSYADINGVAMPDRELDAVIGGLLMKVEIGGGLLGGRTTIMADVPFRPGDTEVDTVLEEADVPFSERNRITEVLAGRWGRKPTPEEVVDQYEMEVLERAGLRPDLDLGDIPKDIVKSIRADHPQGISDEEIISTYTKMMTSPLTR